MILINPQGEYPRHLGDLKLEHPTWDEGEILPDGWIEVFSASNYLQPGFDEILYEIEPSMINGVLNQTLATRPMTSEEIERRDSAKAANRELMDFELNQ